MINMCFDKYGSLHVWRFSIQFIHSLHSQDCVPCAVGYFNDTLWQSAIMHARSTVVTLIKFRAAVYWHLWLCMIVMKEYDFLWGEAGLVFLVFYQTVTMAWWEEKRFLRLEE